MKINVNETVNGYTFYLNHKDYFVVTNRAKKTIKLFLGVLTQMGLPCTPDNARYIMRKSQKAICTLKMQSDGTLYYDICGEGIGGLGSYYDDGNTVILTVNDRG